MPSSLADAAIQQFLMNRDVAILATLQKDGAPLATPMWFVVDTKALYMLSVAATQKVRNLRRDSRACVVVESGTRGAGVQGVTIQGRAEFLVSATEIQPIVTHMLHKYEPHLANLWNGTIMPPNRLVWRIVPTNVYSWGL